MELPPVLQLLLSTLSPGVLRDDKLFKKAMSDRGFVRALQQQARYSVEKHSYATANRAPADGLFTFLAPTSLNPFSTSAKCNDANCRALNGNAVATLASLYTDFLAVPDEFAQMFAAEGTVSARDRWELGIALQNYYRLEPLIRAEVIRFAPPPGYTCPHCAAKAHPEILLIVEKFWQFFLEEGRIEVHTGPGHPHLEFATSLYEGLLITHPLTEEDADALGVYRVQGSDQVRRSEMPRFKDLVCNQIATDVQAALEHAAIATDRHLTGATTSILDALSLQAADAPVLRPREIDNWRSLRELKLPWVHDLAPAALLALRDRAKVALPVFREMVSSRIAANHQAADDSDVRLERIVRELREQAEEVRAELAGSRLPQLQALSGLSAFSSIGLTITAIASSNGLAGTLAGGLLGLFAALQQSAHSAEHNVKKVEAKPGYILVAASEILRHSADGQEH